MANDGFRPLYPRVVALKGDFRIAEWTVQPQVNSLRRGDEVYHLEPKVMQVLVELASAPNETLTREHLIQSIWPGRSSAITSGHAVFSSCGES